MSDSCESPGTSHGTLSNNSPDRMEDQIVTQGGAICWNLDRTPFAKEFVKKAEVELNERPEGRTKAIDTFKQMILERGEFTSRMDDAFLLRYLRVRKFDIKRAYKLLRNYFTAIKRYPELFGDPRPSSIKDYIYKYFITILPYRDPEGRAIAVIQIGELDVGKTPFNTGILMGAQCLEAIIDDPVTQVSGIVAVADIRHLTMRLIRHVVTPANCYKLFVLLQDCLPGRLKEIHVVYGSKVVRIGYDTIKVFMKEKMRRRVIFHGDDMTSLHKYIPPEVLPEEYGGTLPLDKSLWADRIISLEEKFIEAVTYGFVKT